jgi:LysM repeat protein
MVLEPDIKDNLTLMGSEDKRSYFMPLLVLLAGVIIAVILFFAFVFNKGHSGTGAAETVKKPVASAKASQRMLDSVKMLVASNNFTLARQQCQDLMQNTADPVIQGEAEKMLGQINMNLLLSPAPMPEKMEYVVKSGDILEKLAKANGTTVDLINRCNSLQGKIIHPGDRLRIFNAKLTIVISKGRNDLLLKANDLFFKRYAVGTGKFGNTPAGTFVISDKISEPPWWRPDGKMIPFGDKENVLGTRWMSLTAIGETPKLRGYGIHGTWENDTIGKQASAGCVRLVNSDVEELFLVVPVGTPVTIVE